MSSLSHMSGRPNTSHEHTRILQKLHPFIPPTVLFKLARSHGSSREKRGPGQQGMKQGGEGTVPKRVPGEGESLCAREAHESSPIPPNAQNINQVVVFAQD